MAIATRDGNVEPLDSMNTRPVNAGCPSQAMVDSLRELLVQHGVCESHSGEQEGFFLVVEGRGEVSLQYNEIKRACSSICAASFRRGQADLFKYCNALADRGYSVTLIASPRTLALYVKSD